MRKHVVIDRATGKVIRETDAPAGVDLQTLLEQEVHDCPECRAATERGEQPIFGKIFAKRPRWRALKKQR